MPDQTEAVIREIEANPEIRDMAIAQIMGLLERELELRDALEGALQRAAGEQPAGWVDWDEVIGHFRRRAVEGIIRDELRRNRHAAGQPRPPTPEPRDED